jgi:hypothetical protein
MDSHSKLQASGEHRLPWQHGEGDSKTGEKGEGKKLDEKIMSSA